MPLVVSKGGSILDLNARRTSFLNTTVIHLFKNDYIPTLNTILADLVEADFSNYTSLNLSWPNAVFLNGINQAQTNADPVSWVQQDPLGIFNTVFGYYVTRSGGLLWAERFAAPVPILIAGSGLTVTATLTYISQFSG